VADVSKYLEEYLKWILETAEDVRERVRVEKRSDGRALVFSYSRLCEWLQEQKKEACPDFPQDFRNRLRKVYATVFEASEPDYVEIVDLPVGIYPYTIHSTAIPPNSLVQLRGVVTISPYRTFYRMCIKAFCEGEEGEFFSQFCGNFWNAEEPKLPRGCQPIDKHPEFADEDPEVKISVVTFEISDPPEAIEAKAPYRMTVYAIDRIPRVALGDTVEIVGVLRAKKRGKVYEPVIEYVTHRSINRDRLQVVTPEEKEALVKLMKMQFPENFHALVASYAPHLWGLWEAKAVALLSSVLKPEFDDRDRPSIIHVLLAGDRATGKSSLLQTMGKRVKPSIVLSAKSVTTAGLLMGVVNLEGGIRTYQAGLILQHRGGLVGIEEAKDNAQVVEQALLDFADKGEIGRGTAIGSVSVKVATQLALTTNPADGRWSDEISLQDNLRFFSPAFLSRFVIVVTRRSPQAEAYGAVLNLIERKEIEKAIPFTDWEVNAIIKQLRALPNPPLGESAKRELINIMVNVVSKASEDTPVSLRDERKLKLMAQAIAKIDGKSVVEDKHVKLAFEIWKAVLRTQHGKYYANVVNLSTPEEPKKAYVDTREKVYKALSELCDDQRSMGEVEGVKIAVLTQYLAKKYPDAYEKLKEESQKNDTVPEQVLRKLLIAMYSEGKIHKKGNAFCTVPL
jgi:DNA replicative helicase MCM subunit Mcm2 (Cdc46/Mcm family)